MRITSDPLPCRSSDGTGRLGWLHPKKKIKKEKDKETAVFKSKIRLTYALPV